MLAANKGCAFRTLPKRYPEIVAGMKVVERRKAANWLRENLPGFQWSAEFEACHEEKEILDKPDHLPGNEHQSRNTGSREMARYFGGTSGLPLLTREEEVFYFRRMNFLRWRAQTSVKEVDAVTPTLSSLRRIVADLKQGDEDSDCIAEHNLRLVIPLAHRFLRQSESIWDFVSEGNTALLRAIRGFDYTRGFRFSTYATWAIVNSLQRFAARQHRDSTRFVATDGVVFDSVAGDKESAIAEEQRLSATRDQVSSLLDILDPRSRTVIAMRYGIGRHAEPMTLREVGEEFGVSKERVRQIEKKAILSMMTAKQQSSALPA